LQVQWEAAVVLFRRAADSYEEGLGEGGMRQGHVVGELLGSPDLVEGHTSLEVRRKVLVDILESLVLLDHLDHPETLLGRSPDCASVGREETDHTVGVDRMEEADAG
jgi:hypothetical protein